MFAGIPTLAGVAADLIVDSRSASTFRTYATGERAYIRFISQSKIPPELLWPPSPTAVMAFATHSHHILRRSHNSIRSDIFAPASACNLLGFTFNPEDHPQLELLLRGIKRSSHATSRTQRLPITAQLLNTILPTIDVDNPDELTLFATMVVGVFGLFRASELVAKPGSSPSLPRSAVSFHDHSIAKVFLATSKTDTFRRGCSVTVAANGSRICPVAALRHVLASSPNQDGADPLFQLANGRPVTYKILQNFIKVACARVGIRAGVSSHSLRIGGATSLALAGCPAHTIMAMGRWKSLAYQLYTRLDDNAFVRISALLAHTAESGASHPFGGLSVEQACRLDHSNIDAVFSSCM